jgi:hypothetical protein
MIFFCGKLYDAVNISDYMVLLVNNELEKIWKEALIAELRYYHSTCLD